MRISVLQPKIIRGDLDFNLKVIQGLVNKSRGELLVLPEYALTGSLIFEPNANTKEWAEKSKEAKNRIKIPEGKRLLVNSLLEVDDKIYNACELLPEGGKQYKLFPDRPEVEAGINPGNGQTVFELNTKRFKVIICTDLRFIERIPTVGLDFILFIFHFSDYNLASTLEEVKKISVERSIPVLISSLVSDQNIGFSSYIDKNSVISLSSEEGILEIELGD
ncbi:MAG: hypothetical protein GX081_10740 [Firmicutes bacterium]|nr:hypothetical protein [Bacillota bacterium]